MGPVRGRHPISHQDPQVLSGIRQIHLKRLPELFVGEPRFRSGQQGRFCTRNYVAPVAPVQDQLGPAVATPPTNLNNPTVVPLPQTEDPTDSPAVEKQKQVVIDNGDDRKKRLGYSTTVYPSTSYLKMNIITYFIIIKFLL